MRAFRIAYDGTPYSGFQRQPDVSTVEDALFDALRSLEILPETADKPDGYAAAGRTDAGVSALAQTIAFEAPEWLAPRALNSELPPTIRAWASARAPPEFHATHHATAREYTYYLHAPPDIVDHELVAEAVEALSGTHDFHNLTPDDDNTRRSPMLEATREGDVLRLSVQAGGFPRELVRRLISLIEAVGTGARPLDSIDRVLDPEPLPGHEGIGPAPPEPLVLTDVDYPELAFELDETAAQSTRTYFDSQRIERDIGSRVSRQLRDGVR